MGAINRLLQFATILGLLTIVAGVALTGVVAYLWWEGRRDTTEYEFDTHQDVRDVSADGAEPDTTGDTVAAEGT